MAVLDGSIANLALPVIGRSLGVDAASSIWIVNAYQLAIVICLLPLGALGERLGFRRVYLGGVLLFVLGSLCCAFSPSLPLLALSRTLQGVGAAGIMSVNTALVRFTYPARSLGRAFGFNGVIVAIFSAVGPGLAGAILHVASWPWLFLINLPIGAIVLVIGARTLPYRQGTRAPMDWPAALLNALALGPLIFGIETLSDGAWMAGLAEIGIGVLAGAWLVRREFRSTAPLIPLDLLRIPLFRLSVLTSVAAFAAQMAAGVVIPFQLQSLLNRPAVEAGLLMMAWPLASAITAPLSGHFSDRARVGLLAGAGLGLLGIGLALLAILPTDAQNWDIAARMALCGIGFALFQSPNNRALVGSSPPHRSGAAGSMLAMARVSGQTLGAVMVAAVFHAAGLHASPAALLAAALLAGAGMAASLFRLKAT
ncbi:MAG: Permease of the major facilitator superfamily [Caulobacteraceae bacterium]|nr:Permease of the major facilitator superfamily [Caulobacteraceae bacterium]